MDESTGLIGVNGGLADLAERREGFQHPVGDQVDRPGDEENAGRDQQRAHGPLDVAQMALETRHESHVRRRI